MTAKYILQSDWVIFFLTTPLLMGIPVASRIWLLPTCFRNILVINPLCSWVNIFIRKVLEVKLLYHLKLDSYYEIFLFFLDQFVFPLSMYESEEVYPRSPVAGKGETLPHLTSLTRHNCQCLEMIFLVGATGSGEWC